MEQFKIRLNNVEDVKEFVRDTNTLREDVYAVSGRYVIDAKSIMGMFSLDLTHDICIECSVSNPNEIEVFDKWKV